MQNWKGLGNFAQKINGMVIERTPEINEEELFNAIISPQDRQIEEIVERVNESFAYWDSVKYKSALPDIHLHNCGPLSRPPG